MTKEEIIEKAWNDIGFNNEDITPFKDVFYENGWILFDIRFKYLKPDIYDPKLFDFISIKYLRPKSLSGIETNNGWTKIESEEDLPKKSGLYFIKRRKTNSIELVEIKLYVKSNIKFSVRNYSHYKPIIKPNPPIY